MFTLEESVTYLVVRTENFYILYNLVYSVNPYFEDYELWEYGIKCTVYSESNEIQSTSSLSHIHYNKDIVAQMLYSLAENKVFPVHLYDVVTELIESDLYHQPITPTQVAS